MPNLLNEPLAAAEPEVRLAQRFPGNSQYMQRKARGGGAGAAGATASCESANQTKDSESKNKPHFAVEAERAGADHSAATRQRTR